MSRRGTYKKNGRFLVAVGPNLTLTLLVHVWRPISNTMGGNCTRRMSAISSAFKRPRQAHLPHVFACTNSLKGDAVGADGVCLGWLCPLWSYRREDTATSGPWGRCGGS